MSDILLQEKFRQRRDQSQVQTDVAVPHVDMTQYLYGSPYNKDDVQRESVYSVDQRVKNTERYQSLADNLTFGPASVLAGLVETFGSSLTFGTLPDNFIEEKMKGTKFGDFYSHNKDWAKVIADIGGMVVPGTVMMKAFQAESWLGRAVEGFKYGDKISKALFSASASRGAMYKALEAKAVDWGKKTGTVDWAAGTGPEFWRRESKNIQWGSVLDRIKENIAFEVGVFATMNQSDVLYPDDWTIIDHLQLGVPLPAAAAGIEFLFARRQLANIAASAGGAGIERLFGKDLDALVAVSRFGDRGLSATQNAYLLNKLKEAETNGMIGLSREQSSALSVNVKTARKNVEEAFMADIKTLGRDNVFKGVTTKFTPDNREYESVKAAIDKNPWHFIDVVSIEPLSGSGSVTKDFSKAKAQKIKALQMEIYELDKESRKPENANKIIEYFNKIDLKKQAIREHKKLTPVVIETSGEITSAAGRKVIAQDFLEPDDIKILPDGKEDLGFIFVGGDNRVRGLKINARSLIPEFNKTEIESKVDAGAVFMAGFEVSKYKPQKYKIGKGEPPPLTFGEFEAAGSFTNVLAAAKQHFTSSKRLAALFGSQNLEQRTATYAAMDNWIQAFIKRAESGAIKEPLQLDPTVHYVIADTVTELAEKLGESKFRQFVSLPEGMKIEDIRQASLASKYRDWSILLDIAGDKKGRGLRDKINFTDSDIRHYLNLPQVKPGDTDPVTALFTTLRGQKETDFYDAVGKWENVYPLVNDALRNPLPTDFTELTHPVRLTGNLLDSGYKTKRPVLTIMRGPMDQNLFKMSALQERAAVQRIQILSEFAAAAQNSNAPIAQLVYDTLFGTPGYNAATNMYELANGTQRGTSTIGQILAQIPSRQFGLGESPTLKGTDYINQQVSQRKNAKIGEFFKLSGYDKAAPKVLSDPNHTQNYLEFVNAIRTGWDVLPDAEKVADGWVFVLDPKSKRNKKLFNKFYGQEMPGEGTKVYLPGPVSTSPDNPKWKPLLLKNEGFELANSTRTLSDLLLNEMNFLRKNAGKGPIQRREWWVPTVNLANRHVNVFRRKDLSGEVVYVAAADSPEQLRTLTDRTMRAFERDGENIVYHSFDANTADFEAADKIFEKAINFTDPFAQTGPITGKLSGPVVLSGRKALEDIQRAIEQSFQSVFRRNTVLLMEPYVNQVKQLDAAIKTTARGKGLNNRTTQKYLNLIYDNPTADRDYGIGRIYSGIEQFADTFLLGLQEKVRPGSTDFKKTDQKVFDEYAKYMGTYNPYTDALDMAERNFQMRIPPTMRSLGHLLNSLTTNLTLRIGEFGHPLLNMTSLASTFPAVVRSLMLQSGESFADYQKRIGPFGTVISEEAAKNFTGIFMPEKFLISSIHDSFTKKIIDDKTGREVLLTKWAGERGDFNQVVNDMKETLVRPHQTGWERRLTDYIDWLSKPSDASEVMARELAYVGFWNIGERLGIKGNRSLAQFAHVHANQVVGDYRPHNRPQIFQGAAGMPLGLFTTYMWNYNERLLRMMENKQHRLLLTQLATQAALFGMNSVPGYSEFVNVFASNYDGTSNPLTGMQNRLGPEFTDWWSYGTLSNLTGIAIYQRGDSGLKVGATLFNPLDAPAVQTLKKFYGAGAKALAALRDNGLSPSQIAQISAQFSISRPYRNAVELYQGYSLDAQDRIISKDLYNFTSVAARVLGMKPLTEAKNTEAWFNVGSGRFARADRLDQLRDNFRYAIREGKFSGDAGRALLADYIHDYIENGGTYDGFVQFARNNILLSQHDRSTVELKNLLSGNTTSKEMEDIRRLMWSMTPPNDDEFELMK